MFGLKNRKLEKKRKLAKMARKLVTVSDSKSIISEQFRTIRTNISFSMPDQELKTILVTSSTPGEGKSTIAANLGVVYAQEGKRVLIIDGDLRKPTLHQTFKRFNKAGLCGVLAKKVPFYEAIQETTIEGLNIMTSGPIPPNPAELLSSKALDILIQDVKKDYDIILFDAPPLLIVSDAQILSNKCDGTLLIANTGVVEKEIIVKAKAILASSQANVLGVVLNNYVFPRHQQYDGYYSHDE